MPEEINTIPTQSVWESKLHIEDNEPVLELRVFCRVKPSNELLKAFTDAIADAARTLYWATKD